MTPPMPLSLRIVVEAYVALTCAKNRQMPFLALRRTSLTHAQNVWEEEYAKALDEQVRNL